MLSNDGIWGVIADSTSVSSTKSDESRLSPSSSPRVLDSPEAISHSNQKDTVIHICSTGRHNSTSVSAPRWGIDSYRNWLFVNGVIEVIAAWSISECWNSVWSNINYTYLIFSCIWVSICSGQSVVHDILESAVHPSSVASLISITSRAINELLFRKVGRGIFEFVSRLNGSNSWESPAWTARSLILNRCNFSTLNPINITKWLGAERFKRLSYLNFLKFLVDLKSEVLSSKLRIGEISELVDSLLVCLSWVSIMFLNLHKIIT